MPCHATPQGTTRGAPGSVRRQRGRGKSWARVFIVVSTRGKGKEKAR